VEAAATTAAKAAVVAATALEAAKAVAVAKATMAATTAVAANAVVFAWRIAVKCHHMPMLFYSNKFVVMVSCKLLLFYCYCCSQQFC